MQKHQRRPGATATAAPPATLPPTRLGVFWTENNGSTFFPVTAAQKTIVGQTTRTQLTTINNTGTIVGATVEPTNELTGTQAQREATFATYDGLSQLDARFTAMAAAAATGTDLTLVLNAAPWWMLGKPRDGNYATVNDYTVTDANVTVWAQFVGWLLDRYWAQGLRNLVWWSEQKGYYLNTLNRWDYVREVANYNAIWAECKARRPTVKIGGLYVTTRLALDHKTGIPSIASDGTSIRSSITVSGEGWHMNARSLDSMIYFKANATGYDFVCCDGSIWPATDPAIVPSNPDMRPVTLWPLGTANTVQHVLGDVVFDDREKIGLVVRWLKDHFPGTPVWWVESYFGSGVDPVNDFNAFYDSGNAEGLDMLVFWHGKNAPRVGASLWTPSTDTRTALGDRAAVINALP